MNDNKLIRVNNLNRLGLSAVELSSRVGGRISYWHGMLTGTRPFGEKAARKIEESLDLPRGSMDEDEGTQAAQPALYKPSGFALALARMYDALPEDDAIRSTAWLNVQQAILQARDLQNNPSPDAPKPGRAAKRQRG